MVGSLKNSSFNENIVQLSNMAKKNRSKGYEALVSFPCIVPNVVMGTNHRGITDVRKGKKRKMGLPAELRNIRTE